jgi:hypothetical protein
LLLLFTVTHVGTPVIIAGAKSDPWEPVHPGLELGGVAKDELVDAVARLDARKHPADWEAEAEHPVKTVLATGRDRRIVLIENREDLVEDTLTVSGAPTLGETVTVRFAPGASGAT